MLPMEEYESAPNAHAAARLSMPPVLHRSLTQARVSGSVSGSGRCMQKGENHRNVCVHLCACIFACGLMCTVRGLRACMVVHA